MKVYVAEKEWDCEGFEIMGVFSSREAAQKVCDTDHEKTGHDLIMNGYSVEEFEVDLEEVL